MILSIHMILIAFQYVVEGLNQDFLSGLFGKTAGGNGGLMIYLSVILCIVICQFEYKKISTKKFVCYLLLIFVNAALSELKFLFVLASLLVVWYLAMSKRKGRGMILDYAFQDINDIPGTLPEGRTKPWGTGQAVLAAKDVIKTPFIVINADDYYGKEGFKAVHEYLVNGGKSCMAGFVLKNTLSDNGGVTRGICKMDEQNNLTEVVETKNIVKTATGAEADSVVVDVNSLVSMNMWGLTPDFLDVLEEGFKEFFEKEVPSNPLKAEYLIPIFIGELLEQGKMSVKVLKTNDTWYGMTYHEDVAAVKDSFKKMLENGVYKADLFSDL